MFKFSRLGPAGIMVAVLLLVFSQVVVKAELPMSQSGPSYTIQAGDDLWTLGDRFGVTAEALAEANGMSLDEPLEVGKPLIVPKAKELLYQVKPGENLWSIAGKYRLTVQSLIKANKFVNPDKLQIGQLLYLPKAATKASRGTGLVQTGVLPSFDWPVIGTITSGFGWRQNEFHMGLDIAANKNTEITVPRAGTVVYSGWLGTYGNMVKVDHGDGFTTLYAHASRTLVRVGQQVVAGQAIAKVGSTGRSTGPHLHFEVRYDGTLVDPLRVLKNATVIADL